MTKDIKIEKKKIVNFFKKRENLIFIPTGLLLILSVVSLFIKDFNLLKLFVFFDFVVALSVVGTVIYAIKKPVGREESLLNLIQNLLDFLKEGIAIYDNEFKIVFVNKAFSQITNLEKESIINLIVDQGMIKNERYEMLANIFFPFLTGENIKVISQDPEIIEVKFSSPKEKIFLISYMDITLINRKYKLRIVLDKTEDVLEGQRKLEFVQLVSENLSTPLSEIRWTLEAMDTQNFSDENKKFLESALNIIKSTINLVEVIFAMLRFEEGKLELFIQNVDLKQVVEDVLSIFDEKIEEKKLKVELKISDDVKTIVGDKNMISMLFYSLIENAILYNKVNGEVLISAQKIFYKPYAEIIIQDTGIGMSKEDLENLFKKYYRSKKAKELNVKSFGIGLYTAKHILDLHGAEIKVESEEGKGTKISIAWPLDKSLIPH